MVAQRDVGGGEERTNPQRRLRRRTAKADVREGDRAARAQQRGRIRQPALLVRIVVRVIEREDLCVETDREAGCPQGRSGHRLVQLRRQLVAKGLHIHVKQPEVVAAYEGRSVRLVRIYPRHVEWGEAGGVERELGAGAAAAHEHAVGAVDRRRIAQQSRKALTGALVAPERTAPPLAPPLARRSFIFLWFFPSVPQAEVHPPSRLLARLARAATQPCCHLGLHRAHQPRVHARPVLTRLPGGQDESRRGECAERHGERERAL